jgi:protein-disulfide isomerase
MAPDSHSGIAAPKTRAVLDILATVTMLVVALIMGWATLVRPRVNAKGTEVALPAKPLSLQGAALSGNPRARIALIEYSDFQCPFCGKFARETLPGLENKYVKTGIVVLAFRHLPLPKHQFAAKAAMAATCAGYQNKFWEMHDLLFRDQVHLDPPSLAQGAQSIGLHEARFIACLTGSEVAASLERDAREAVAVNISSTPAFIVGLVLPDGSVQATKLIGGAQPLETFAAAIDQAQEKQRTKR